MLNETDFEAFEEMFKLPKGSTLATKPEQRTKKITKALADKSTELIERSNEISIITNLETSELVKADIDIKQLEADREVIMAEAFQTQRIGKMVLNKIYSDIKDTESRLDAESIDSIAKMLNSVVSTEKHLAELNNRYRQEEEMKMVLNDQPSDDDGSKELAGHQFLDVIEAFKKDNEDKKSKA